MKRMLITGATGAIGSALVPLFLEERETKVLLILRARSPEHLRQRLQELFRFWELRSSDSLASGRLEAFPGDVCLPNLGLEESIYRRLRGEVTHLIHAAGNVKLNLPLEEARRESVLSDRQVVTLARACRQNGQFSRLFVVSTLGVAGRIRGLIEEKPISQPRRFRNTYEQAKAEAEQFLFTQMEGGLPLTIFRPSMVVGDSRTGKVIHFQVFYHLSEFLSGRPTGGIAPAGIKEMLLDIIPVDLVAQAIFLAHRHDETNGQILHLCSGPGGALPVAELMELVRPILGSEGQPLPQIRTIPTSWFRGALSLIRGLAPPKIRQAARNLTLFLDYMDEPQSFDNARTRALLASEGLEIPHPKEYLEKILRYYRCQVG